jgi:hypothetical protein
VANGERELRRRSFPEIRVIYRNQRLKWREIAIALIDLAEGSFECKGLEFREPDPVTQTSDELLFPFFTAGIEPFFMCDLSNALSTYPCHLRDIGIGK